MRMRAERQNCDSNFSRLARQRRLPAVAARLFFSFNNFHGLAATYGVNRIDGLRVRNEVNPKKSIRSYDFFKGFAIEHKLRGFFFIGVEECKRLLMNF